jgi:hypothetical protein
VLVVLDHRQVLLGRLWLEVVEVAVAHTQDRLRERQLLVVALVVALLQVLLVELLIPAVVEVEVEKPRQIAEATAVQA